jgi:tRNA A37 threonylcarbamoyltransferase TsaD
LRKIAFDTFGEDNTFIPPPILCTDNAAMIAGLAFHFSDKVHSLDLKINATADLPL